MAKRRTRASARRGHAVAVFFFRGRFRDLVYMCFKSEKVSGKFFVLFRLMDGFLFIN